MAREIRAQQARARIAELAARFIAEHGLHDYAVAKRKAARQLGFPEGQGLPSNEEVDAALLERQELFEPEEMAATLDSLRLQAAEVMRVFERFQPILTGGVVAGIISEHSLVELEIDLGSSKDFEQFLVNRGIEYKIQDKGARMAYLIYAEPADILVRMVAPDSRHTNAPHLSLERLSKLLAVTAA